jgi:signal transduction histidine kinase
MEPTLNQSTNQPLILIVDDLPENLKVIGSTLMARNFNIIVALNGQEAIDLAITEKPDLILLDIQMPEMDGYEVCKRLKENSVTADIPVIFLTARADVDDVVKGFEVGGEDYLTKPFQPKELLARVKTHIKLKLSMEKLAELNATKDKFFSIIAHDLKNPFTGIMGFTEILKTDYAKYNQEEILEIYQLLDKTAKTAYELLENLLEWSRSQTNRLDFNPQLLLFEDIVMNSFSLVENMAKQKNINLLTSYPKDLVIFGDLYLIKTIFRNLITNAVKYTNPNGSVTIKAIDTGEFFEISVIDTGVGISAENLGKLFKVDVKMSTKGTADESGTGLGLILCKEFVEKHGGRIWVESAIEHGSIFTFSLPKN